LKSEKRVKTDEASDRKVLKKSWESGKNHDVVEPKRLKHVRVHLIDRLQMKKSGRSSGNCSSLEGLRIELLFRGEIEESNLYLAGSLACFFGVLYAYLTEQVKGYFGLVLILTAIMMIWYLRDKRKETRRKYEKEIELLATRSRRSH